jgi:dTDP-4-amino-4,6-dideoxygalactose transaminase
MVTKFESAFAKVMKTKHAIAVNTGTSALHLAILSAEIKENDEVILPSFTFVATAEAIVIAGARPVFVDIDPGTYNISPRKIEKAITKNTKAIIPVDLYGLPAEMLPIKEIAEKHGLTIIEDAAQAHGATYKGKPPGAFADIACWSFYASKNMTTGEGGMVTTNNDEIAEKIRFMRSHGEKEKYESIMLGHNYHMSELHAAIGWVQLKKLSRFSEIRSNNSRRITVKLREQELLRLPREPEDCRHSWYLYTIRLKDSPRRERDRIVKALQQKNIGAAVYYSNPIHLMSYYRQFGEFRLEETEKAAGQVFSLPVHPGVTEDQLEFIGESVLNLTG